MFRKRGQYRQKRVNFEIFYYFYLSQELRVQEFMEKQMVLISLISQRNSTDCHLIFRVEKNPVRYFPQLIWFAQYLYYSLDLEYLLKNQHARLFCSSKDSFSEKLITSTYLHNYFILNKINQIISARSDMHRIHATPILQLLQPIGTLIANYFTILLLNRCLFGKVFQRILEFRQFLHKNHFYFILSAPD